jgi:tetratricopeptide (TPR) repeat protein
LAADLVGYSELVFRDPHRGIGVLRETRTILIDCIRERGGRILQTPGDFVLATFEDLYGAMPAAISAQQKLLHRHQEAAKSDAGHWKIGVAYGDVHVVDDDYYGNAINIAARLQALAGPGEICFTEAVKNFSKLSEQNRVTDIGSQSLKNIDQPVHVFRISLPGYESAAAPAKSDSSTSPKLLRHFRKPVLRLDAFRSLDRSNKTVLFGQALIEEVQLILSRLSNSIVVIESDKLTHDYLLSGSIKSGGPHVRIMVRLTSVSDGVTLWAERFECNLNNSFDIQDQISQEIVAALQLALTEGEHAPLSRRGTASGRAWELFQRGHDFERRYTREGHQKAKTLYEQALRVDESYLCAVVAYGFCHLDEVRLGWTFDEVNSIREAEALCSRAVELASDHPDVLALLAYVRFFQNREEDARDAMQRAVELAPQSPEIIGYQGALFDLMGNYEAAVRAYNRALSLSPHAAAWIPANLGLSALALGRLQDAERIYRELLQHHPNYARAWIGLTVALVRQGRMSEARKSADNLVSLDPGFTAGQWARSRPFNDERLLQSFVKDLRAAGLPDEQA